MDANIELEAKNVILMLQQSPFFVAGVTSLDGTHSKQPVDVPTDVLEKVAAKIVEKCPTGSFMLIGVGPKCCTIFALSNCSQLQAKDWLCAVGTSETMIYAYENEAKYTVAAALKFAEYPIKDKDSIISNACAHLRKLKLLPEEEEEYHPPFDF